MPSTMQVVFLVVALAAFVSAVPSADKKCNIIPGLVTLPLLWKWETRTASVLPDPCNFIYGGGSKRMLYVGRVRTENGLIPAAIHHYGKSGSETVHVIENGAVTVFNNTKPVEWLCGKGNLGWANVKDLSTRTILAKRAVPLGFDLKTKKIQYGCIAHSFFSDQYPASVGVVVDGGCQFEVNGNIVNTNDFKDWHTVELLVVV